MNKDEIMKKISDLIGEGNFEKAQEFIEEHKEDLGEYADKAKAFLKEHGGNLDDLMEKAQGFLKEEGNDLLGKAKGFFDKK